MAGWMIRFTAIVHRSKPYPFALSLLARHRSAWIWLKDKLIPVGTTRLRLCSPFGHAPSPQTRHGRTRSKSRQIRSEEASVSSLGVNCRKYVKVVRGVWSGAFNAYQICLVIDRGNVMALGAGILFFDPFCPVLRLDRIAFVRRTQCAWIADLRNGAQPPSPTQGSSAVD